MHAVINAALYAMLGLSGLSLVRLIIGPSSEDRMIALSLVSSQVLSMLVLLAVKQSNALYLDVALVYAVLGYVGILAIAKFIMGGK